MRKMKTELERHWYHKEKISIPTFHWRIWIVFTDDPEAYGRKIGGSEDESGTTNALCLHYPSEMKTEVVLKLNATHGTIAHECWHAVRHMLLQLDAGLDNEVVAYHLGYVVDQVYDIKRSYRKKLRKRKK